jgi:hypothetical protein
MLIDFSNDFQGPLIAIFKFEAYDAVLQGVCRTAVPGFDALAGPFSCAAAFLEPRRGILREGAVEPELGPRKAISLGARRQKKDTESWNPQSIEVGASVRIFFKKRVHCFRPFAYDKPLPLHRPMCLVSCKGNIITPRRANRKFAVAVPSPAKEDDRTFSDAPSSVFCCQSVGCVHLQIVRMRGRVGYIAGCC